MNIKIINIMKKHLILFGLIFSMFAAFAQETKPVEATPANSATVDSTDSFCPHRINIYLGGSFSNNIYNRVNDAFIYTNYSFGSILELKYAYFFTEHWGLSLGVGISKFSAKGTMNVKGIIENYPDPNVDTYTGHKVDYDLIFSGKGFVEKQNIWAIEIPLQAQFEHKFGGRHGIYAGLGIKGFFPFSSNSKFPVNEGNITTAGWEENFNVLYQNLPGRFETRAGNATPSKVKMRCSIDLQADFGGVFGMSKKADFYLGVYTSLGFLDILPKAEKKVEFITPTQGEVNYSVNSLLGSNYLANYNAYVEKNGLDWKVAREKWHYFQVGLKVGVHIKPCATNEPSMKDLKKKYYEEMAKKANDPIIIKNTEYVYIVPTCPEGYEEDEELTPATKKGIQELAKELSNIKILFDLNKDVPKINDQNDNITRAVDILKKDKSLGLIIEGYTCDLGSEEHNRDLSQRRAERVRQLFIDRGVSPSQITIAAYTANDPESKRNIPDKTREEHRAAIFRIIVN
jgi:outer membrane protein OmpA-like peptidoglycan-associated protein